MRVYCASVVALDSRERERRAERLLRFTDHHPVLAVALPMAALVSVYLAWGVATVAPVLTPEQAMNRCLAQHNAVTGTVSTVWELVPPRWNCVFYDHSNDIERRVRLKIER